MIVGTNNNVNIVATDDEGSEESNERTTDNDREVLTTDQFRRDEVKEVRKMSSKDTSRLRLWRIVVTGVLLLTAFAITFTTYTLLKQQEEKNFQTAVRCHSSFQSCFTAINFEISTKQTNTGTQFQSLLRVLASFYHLINTVRAICTYRW